MLKFLFLRSREHVVIATVVCGQQMSETALVMIKSAILFQRKSRLTFIIFAEFDLHADFHTRVSASAYSCDRVS